MEDAMTLILSLFLALAQDPDRVPDLIRKLGSEDYATREQATEDLRKIGKPAREALQKAAEGSDDPEVRQRAQALLDEKPGKPDAPPRRLPAPVPGRPGVRGSSVAVTTVNGDSTYSIRPFDDTPALTFHKAAVGRVKLEYRDENGEAQSAEAPTIEAFLKDHADLARKFGITEDGIDYAGSRVFFKGQGAPGFGFRPFNGPPAPRRVPPPPRDEDGTAVAGAVLEPVDDAVRSQLDLPEGQGVVVTRVVPGSAAEALGLRKNDILLEIDGRAIASADSAKGVLARDSKVTVLRKGKRETFGGHKDF
jgi:hypothetical protein